MTWAAHLIAAALLCVAFPAAAFAQASRDAGGNAVIRVDSLEGGRKIDVGLNFNF